MSPAELIPLAGYRRRSDDEMIERSRWFLEVHRTRRTVRDFSSDPVPVEVIENALRAAGSAPSGANLQPWQFVVIEDKERKSRIRQAAEQEEKQFYTERAPQEWLDALEALGTDWRKPFLETAPFLIAVFVQRYGVRPDGKQVKHYYAIESVGIATGMLINALHYCGLATLTHTPSPMGFLNEILDRPENERPFLLLVVGYPAEGARVPDISRKRLSEFAEFL